jgi:hypothetical protein
LISTPRSRGASPESTAGRARPGYHRRHDID